MALTAAKSWYHPALDRPRNGTRAGGGARARGVVRDAEPDDTGAQAEEGRQVHDGTPFNADAVRFNLDPAEDKAISSMGSELTSTFEIVARAPAVSLHRQPLSKRL